MSTQVGKTTKRSRPNHFYAIVSITLVLFLLGILGMVLVYSGNISRYLKEQIEVSVYIQKDVTEVDILKFQKQLEKKPFVEEAVYVSKEEAVEIFKEQKEDFNEDLELIGMNPLPASVNLKINSEYVNPDSMNALKADLMKNTAVVRDVFYWRGAVDVMNNNIAKITLTLFILSIILFVIALVLIDNTIRLSMYSNRFLIRSMQLVGATRWFIVKPFISRSVINGVLSGLAAVVALFGVLYYLQNQFPALIRQGDIISFIFIFIFILLVGVAISFVSTYFAINKYLRMKLDELY